jgi:FtsH-binding integral membrane protein
MADNHNITLSDGTTGNPQDLSAFFNATGVDVPSMLKTKKRFNVKSWYLHLSVVFFCILLILTWIYASNPTISTPLFIITFIVSSYAVCVSYLLYREKTITLIAAITAIMLMFVSLKVLTPKEALQHTKEIINKHIDNN